MKHVVVCWVISIVRLGQNLKKGDVNSEFISHTLCRYGAYSVLY
jgi:hypothetical protein